MNKSGKTKINEILDQKDLTRWFEMEPTEEEMKGTNRKRVISGYMWMIFGQVFLIISIFLTQELGWRILYGILLGSSVWAEIFSGVRRCLKKEPGKNSKPVIK